MREPKFKLGEVVRYKLSVEAPQNPKVKFNTIVDGIVTGVFYDHKCMSSGRPYYYYTLTIFDSDIHSVPEKDIMVCEVGEENIICG